MSPRKQQVLAAIPLDGSEVFRATIAQAVFGAATYDTMVNTSVVLLWLCRNGWVTWRKRGLFTVYKRTRQA